MTQWQALSEPYFTDDRYMVGLVSSSDELRDLGNALRNGLAVPMARDKWAGLAAEGRRQYASIMAPNGALVGSAQLRVYPNAEGRGELGIFFVRGTGNELFGPEDAIYQVAQKYVDAVNAGEVALQVELNANGFSVPAIAAPQAVQRTPWEVAQEIAEQRGITPMQAMIQGLAVVPEANLPVADEAAENPEWTKLSDGYTAENGLLVEPANTKKALAFIGDEMENMLFVDFKVDEYVRRSQNGEISLLAIGNGSNHMLGFAELGAVNGQVVLVSVRGPSDLQAAPEVAQAALEYVARLNAGLVPGQGLFAGAQGFVTERPENVLDLVGNAPAVLPRGLERTMQQGFGGGMVALGGYDDEVGGELGYDEEEEEEGLDDDDLHDRQPAIGGGLEGVSFAAPLNPNYDRVQGAGQEWTALSTGWTAPNGMLVEPVANEADLAEMGGVLGNALASGAGRRMYMQKAVEGQVQFFRVISADGDRLVGNGTFKVDQGRVALNVEMGREHLLGAHNGAVSAEVRSAVDAYLQAVNNHQVDLDMTVGLHGFEQPRLGYGR